MIKYLASVPRYTESKHMRFNLQKMSDSKIQILTNNLKSNLHEVVVSIKGSKVIVFRAQPRFFWKFD